jgi:hypothetical protein
MRVCNSSNLDGEVQNMEVMTPLSDYGNQYNEDYLNEFWEGDDFNFANGKRSRRGKSRGIIQNVFGKNTIFNADERARRRERRQQRRDTRTGARSSAKQLQAQAQVDIAKSMQDKSGDIALANALKGDTKKVMKKGLSTGAIVGIVVGGLVVAGVIAYFVIKKKGSGAVAPTGTGIK